MELLDQLTGCIGCAFLSDLRFFTATPGTELLIAGIPDSAYSLEEWNQAVDYIAGHQAAPASSVAQAKKRLLDFWAAPQGSGGPG